jgi:hypothetical protein
MRKKLLVVINLLIAGAYCFGQAPGSVDPMISDTAGLGEAVVAKSALDQAEETLMQKGWYQGYDIKTKRFIAIGSAAIKVPSGHPQFYLARKTSYTQAMLDAKKALASFLSQEVSRNIESRYSEPSYGNALEGLQESVPEAPSMIEKAQMLIHSELDALLAEKGIDPNADSEAAAAVVKDLILQSGFQDVIKATARAEVAGLFAYQIYEVAPKQNTGDIAVIAIMSPTTRQLSGAMMGLNPAPIQKAKSSISEWANGISVETLISTHGVKVRTDENGFLNLIAFGQSKPQSPSSMAIDGARKKARLAAMGELRSFAGEAVTAQESGGVSESYEEYADGTSAYASEESIEITVTARAESLSMPGISAVRRWSGVDSRSNEQIEGVILSWNLGSALDANVLRDQLKASAGSAGGRGVSGSRPVNKSGTGAGSVDQKTTHSPYSQSGLESEDDDF